MKIPFNQRTPHPALSPSDGERGRWRFQDCRGSAVLIVVVLIGCIGILLYANSKTLYVLKEDLKLLNLKQQAKYGQSARR